MLIVSVSVVRQREVATMIKNGMTFLFEGNIYQVLEFLHVKPGKGAAFVKAKLRNLRTGSTVEKTFNTSIKLEKAMREYQISRVKKDRYENAMQARVLKERQKAYETPVELEQKRRKLKLYIAHMQGYDRDRDRDGGRGINMVTGEIIDWGDIFIADKEHGAVLEDQNRDGIDRIDIR